MVADGWPSCAPAGDRRQTRRDCATSLNLRGARVWRADGARAEPVDVNSIIADGCGHGHLRKMRRPAGSSGTRARCLFHFADTLLFGFRDMATSPTSRHLPPVGGLASRSGLAVAVQAATTHQTGGGWVAPTGTSMPNAIRTASLAPVGAPSSDGDVEERIGVGPQMQPRLAKVPAIVLER